MLAQHKTLMNSCHEAQQECQPMREPSNQERNYQNISLQPQIKIPICLTTSSSISSN